MGFLDKLKDLTRPFDEDEFDDEMNEDYTADTVRPATSAERSSMGGSRPNPFSQTEFSAPAPAAKPTATRSGNNIVNIAATTQVSVVLVKPERFETAAEIADHLREKRTVVMNLEQTQKDVARRLIDFLSGVAYAQDGKIKKIANSTYLITPYNVDLMGDLMDELENSGVTF